MSEMAKLLYRLSQQAEAIRITSSAGTDLLMTANYEGDSFWGKWLTDGYAQILGGQSWPQVFRESLQGTLVYDGAMWPSAELGILRGRVALTIDKGYAIAVEGGGEALIYGRWLRDFSEPTAMLMDHACYDFNPGIIKASGRILEDERVFGCMQFGVGATELGSPVHSDSVVLNPSVGSMACRLSRKGDTSVLN
jgi:leucyl aminopeptidase (aminopeptidase T)